MIFRLFFCPGYIWEIDEFLGENEGLLMRILMKRYYPGRFTWLTRNET
jgi:CYTH domain-containing protein